MAKVPFGIENGFYFWTLASRETFADEESALHGTWRQFQVFNRPS